MSATTTCDICAQEMRPDAEVTYRVERADRYGEHDPADVCSTECLAALAVRDSRLLGEADAARACREKRTHEQPRRRRWL